MGWTQLLKAGFRNTFVLKPKGRRAAGAVRQLFATSPLRLTKIEVTLGFQAAEGLSCNAFVASDAELAHAKSIGLEDAATAAFEQALRASDYPATAISQVRVRIHSEETIARVGWQYWK